MTIRFTYGNYVQTQVPSDPEQIVGSNVVPDESYIYKSHDEGRFMVGEAAHMGCSPIGLIAYIAA